MKKEKKEFDIANLFCYCVRMIYRIAIVNEDGEDNGPGIEVSGFDVCKLIETAMDIAYPQAARGLLVRVTCGQRLVWDSKHVTNLSRLAIALR